MPREEGKAAFPEIGTILAMVGVIRTARQNRERAAREYYQQQACPKCGDVVAMIRPRGEQFRTFCQKCQAYRKIIPEDQQLSPSQWEDICITLDVVFREWMERGAKYSDCVDPQVDRATLRRIA